MIHFHVEKQFYQDGQTELLNEAAKQTLQDQGAPEDYALSVVLTGDEKLHELNAQFMGQDKPTDVLSFSSGDAEESRYLGDVIISVQQAQAQAERRGHSLNEELQLLTIHGVLHLLGHDHAGAEQREAMWAAQARVLTGLGVSADIVFEDGDD
ncbi:MAG: rRNA maturation RNase YbeY [Anaerolineales bacterium]|nr:rRNA maturation RNase YbeY [Anaerolineales bacterium]